jgi:hypothetical protein
MVRINQDGPVGVLLRIAALVGPAVLLILAWLKNDGNAALWLGVGAGADAVAILVALAVTRGLPALGSGILWTWPVAWIFVTLASQSAGSEKSADDWYFLLLQGLLPLPLLGVMSAFTIRQSGALLIQQAQRVAGQILHKIDWPTDLQTFKDLPLIQEFSESIRFDATPAVQMLENPKFQVRLAALTAMENRRYWRAGQIERVVALLHKETQPELLAAAMRTLIDTHESRILETVAEKLKHPHLTVRLAAATVVLRETTSRRRWSYIRNGVHNALCDGSYRDGGSLLPPAVRLNRDAIEDFLAWSGERGLIGARASQTLVTHYAQQMVERPVELTPYLQQLAKETSRSTELRVALTRLLCERGYADQAFLEVLLDAANPAPLRLLAADALLKAGPHMRSIASLRELGRQPNRELALDTADVVQRRLGVDMGLAMGQALPSVNSNRAVEVQRRLMSWAAKVEHSENALDTNFPAIMPRPQEH